MHELIQLYKDVYGDDTLSAVLSPLRICPLGAHVDHQGGIVTGLALDENVEMVFSASDDGYVRIQSADFPDEEYFHIDRVPEMLPGSWGNYARGAVLALSKDQKLTTGFRAVISGRLPIGGLSSSAAVTTAYLLALCHVNQLNVKKEDLVYYSHDVETSYIGLKNGILDQSANLLSRKGHLLTVDCKMGNHQLMDRPNDMPEFEVIVVYSGVSKSLISTDYNNRVDECRVGGWLLQELGTLNQTNLAEVKLRDIPDQIYHTYRDQVPGRFQKRLDHYYSEQERVIEGIKAWSAGDIHRFGQLMFASGQSSIDQYECGCPELVTIYQILKELNGVYGARFSGAGYRGCCIGFINPKYKQQIKHAIETIYPTQHPKFKDQYKVYFCEIGDGARLIEQVEEG
ncbi:galactokinase family protein [Gracilibacillus dipsosauri]|uniref:Galactokinase n=1 Tax=Gracilibacillus dipsosauri TaxID=178340 RepID=A0A317L4J0_9BACI|nr:galactokinase family protein [Gracilibacillus dipsosauri]PWU70184.1 hypothetical protein DLJ74_01610 [Gracilibacillus dipsosauri]